MCEEEISATATRTRASTAMNEIDWKQELLDSAVFNKKQKKLLKNVPGMFPLACHI